MQLGWEVLAPGHLLDCQSPVVHSQTLARAVQPKEGLNGATSRAVTHIANELVPFLVGFSAWHDGHPLGRMIFENNAEAAMACMTSWWPYCSGHTGQP